MRKRKINFLFKFFYDFVEEQIKKQKRKTHQWLLRILEEKIYKEEAEALIKEEVLIRVQKIKTEMAEHINNLKTESNAEDIYERIGSLERWSAAATDEEKKYRKAVLNKLNILEKRRCNAKKKKSA